MGADGESKEILSNKTIGLFVIIISGINLYPFMEMASISPAGRASPFVFLLFLFSLISLVGGVGVIFSRRWGKYIVIASLFLVLAGRVEGWINTGRIEMENIWIPIFMFFAVIALITRKFPKTDEEIQKKGWQSEDWVERRKSVWLLGLCRAA